MDGGTKRVVGVGRLVRRKGFDTLLDAWGLLGRGSTSVAGPELVLVGDGPERSSLERQVRRSRLRRVTFTGALDRTGVLAQLHRADVFALPVRTRLAGLDPEGLGLAALEASACGLPVVVGRSGGAPETVRPGRTGYVVEPDDPYELATRLADLLTDPARARELGAAGRVFVGDRYGADRARRVLRAALGLPGVATV